MLPKNIYITVITGLGIAGNNRGENADGNRTTLQKVLQGNNTYTTVSAESIRFALRAALQDMGLPICREVGEDGAYGGPYLDNIRNEKKFADDDVFGYMVASKKETIKRKSPLCVSRAISLSPWTNQIMFNCIGDTNKEKGKLSIYHREVHHTRYQWSYGIALHKIVQLKHIVSLLQAIADPCEVGGAHSQNAYDYSPESLVTNITNRRSARIMNCFQDENGETYNCDVIDFKIRNGDILPDETIIAGAITTNEKIVALAKDYPNLRVFSGINKAIEAIVAQIGD